MMNTGSPIGEDDLQAYIDGKLPPDRQALVDAYLAGHPEVSARVTQTACGPGSLTCAAV